MYQSGLKIREALEDIRKNLYVLPAIQREFVWSPEPERSAQFKFYGFVQNYHERDAAHLPELGMLPNRELTAVLDGQQRP